MPANAEIDLNQCSGAWCYASWRDRFGYLPAAAVAPPPFAYPPPAAESWSSGGLGAIYFGYGWSRW